jgi:low temperature requirement protein LtrA
MLAMVEQGQAQRRGRVLGGVHSTSEDHRATPFELFFDLVYVFAVTQVTGYMAEQHSAHGVLQGAAAAHPAVVDLVGLHLAGEPGAG